MGAYLIFQNGKTDRAPKQANSETNGAVKAS